MVATEEADLLAMVVLAAMVEVRLQREAMPMAVTVGQAHPACPEMEGMEVLAGQQLLRAQIHKQPEDLVALAAMLELLAMEVLEATVGLRTLLGILRSPTAVLAAKAVTEVPQVGMAAMVGTAAMGSPMGMVRPEPAA